MAARRCLPPPRRSRRTPFRNGRAGHAATRSRRSPQRRKRNCGGFAPEDDRPEGREARMRDGTGRVTVSRSRPRRTRSARFRARTAPCPAPDRRSRRAAPPTSGSASRRTRRGGAPPRPGLISMATRASPRSSSGSISAPVSVRQKQPCEPGRATRSRRRMSSATNPSQLAPRAGCASSSSAEPLLSRWCSNPVSRRNSFGALVRGLPTLRQYAGRRRTGVRTWLVN